VIYGTRQPNRPVGLAQTTRFDWWAVAFHLLRGCVFVALRASSSARAASHGGLNSASAENHQVCYPVNGPPPVRAREQFEHGTVLTFFWSRARGGMGHRKVPVPAGTAARLDPDG